MTLVRAGLLCVAPLLASCASLPVPPDGRGAGPSRPGLVLHDARTVDRFRVERWVREAAPEVSPSGYCECLVLVYDGDRLVLDLGPDAAIVEVTSSGVDVTGDGRPELVVRRHSGGAHCCESTAIYSAGTSTRQLLSISTGHCPGGLADLDGDGVPELETCDDRFAYQFCSFAFSPMPAVVFTYDADAGLYVISTPRHADRLEDRRRALLAEARERIATYAGDLEVRRCASLGPALDLVYAGRVDEGLALFAQLYDGPDREAIAETVVKMARESPFWPEP